MIESLLIKKRHTILAGLCENRIPKKISFISNFSEGNNYFVENKKKNGYNNF